MAYGVARSCGGHAPAEPRFDGSAEAIRAVEMLALKVRADRVGFLRRHLVHDEGAIVSALALWLGSKGAIDGMRSDHGIVLTECIVPMTEPRIVARVGDHCGA